MPHRSYQHLHTFQGYMLNPFDTIDFGYQLFRAGQGLICQGRLHEVLRTLKAPINPHCEP